MGSYLSAKTKLAYPSVPADLTSYNQISTIIMIIIKAESLLIAVKNNAIRTNHIKARIDKTQQNSKCRLSDDRDETINLVISECSKLAQKEYKTRHDWVSKVIHWEMSKKFKFDHINKLSTCPRK